MAAHAIGHFSHPALHGHHPSLRKRLKVRRFECPVEYLGYGISGDRMLPDSFIDRRIPIHQACRHVSTACPCRLTMCCAVGWGTSQQQNYQGQSSSGVLGRLPTGAATTISQCYALAAPGTPMPDSTRRADENGRLTYLHSETRKRPKCACLGQILRFVVVAFLWRGQLTVPKTGFNGPSYGGLLKSDTRPGCGLGFDRCYSRIWVLRAIVRGASAGSIPECGLGTLGGTWRWVFR